MMKKVLLVVPVFCALLLIYAERPVEPDHSYAARPVTAKPATAAPVPSALPQPKAAAGGSGAAPSLAGRAGGRKTPEEWAAEDAALTHDLPFMRRTPDMDAALDRLNAPHAAKRAAAYPGGRLPEDLGSEHQLHLFFTTDCSKHSLWQSVALEHSWLDVGHPGALSRLVSGCLTDRAGMKPTYDHLKLASFDHPRHFIFFGPTIDALGVPGPKGSTKVYAPINRPATVHYWLFKAMPVEEVIGLLDPDMIFIKPLYFSGVARGKPVAQFYDYLKVEDWDREYTIVCKDCPPIKNKKDYCVGPPHLMHRDDFGDVTQWWIRYTVEARKGWGKWVAEMEGMSMGLARLGLAARLDQYGMWDRPDQMQTLLKARGFLPGAEITALRPEPAHRPLGMHPFQPDGLASLLHYCFTPELGRTNYPEHFWRTDANQVEWERQHGVPLLAYFHWSKYRVPNDWHGNGGAPRSGTLVDCSQDLLFEMPPMTYMMKHFAKTENDFGWIFMLSGMLPAINRGMQAFKKLHCPPRDTPPRKVVRTAHPRFWVSKWELSYNTTHPRGFTFFDADGKEIREDWESVKLVV